MSEHVHEYLLVALVVEQHGIARMQNVFGGLQLRGHLRPLVLALGLGFSELCDLHPPACFKTHI